MPRTSLAYRMLVRSAAALVPAAMPLDAKLARGHRGRLGAPERLETWARQQRDPARPLVWFHAASVGEGLQARAVMRQIRARHPGWQIGFTHFSPSAERFALGVDADVADYLSYDTPAFVARTLDALRPNALIFAKLDVWPELATAAAARGIPVGLVAGTVSPLSRRSGWPWRILTRPAYQVLEAIGAVAQEDARRLVQLGARPDRITVTGDPRYDSVLQTVAVAPDNDPATAWSSGGPALVAGSTWPADEQVVLAAFARVRAAHPGVRLIIAPHEPTGEHLATVERMAASLGLPRPHRWSEGPATGVASLVLVDQVGLLARLYGAGRMAFVGGGFGTAGLHSVLEPAAWGIPVTFGPRWQSSRDAGILIDAEGGLALPGHQPAEKLFELWRKWLDDETARAAAGERAARVVQQGAGAAERSARLVEQLIDGGRSPIPDRQD